VPAYYQLVEGIRLPAPIGGHPALEFCNTYAGWDGATSVEYLLEFDRFALWSDYAGLLDSARVGLIRRRARRERAAADGLLRRVHCFRASLYDLIAGSGSRPSRLVVDEEIRAALPLLRLESQADPARWDVDRSAGLAAPLTAVVWSATQLLTSENRTWIRACEGRGCGWLFLDKRGRRRWCSMATCGNRAKARRFATRHAGH
jgi:predicted RNA-binding Zn ribbon-like protein